MKKSFRALSLILCVVIAALCLVACSDYGAPKHDTSAPDYAVSTADLTTELNSFMSENLNRTTFTDGEKAAATYLTNRLLEMGYSDVGLQEFSTTENEVSNLKSQNVVAHIGSTAANAKNVIIGTYYDNRYSSPYNGAKGDGGEGAMLGGSSVATLLTVANYLVNNKSALGSDLRVTIVFFGASYVSNDGARAYLDKIAENEYKNTVLMIELQRLCGDHLYAFSDARETAREKFFDKIAADSGLNIYKPTSKSPMITGLSALNGVPYFQWSHSGLFGTFFNAGIPTLNLVGANWESANLSDIESASHDDISYSESDTLHNLKRFCPDYAEKMATAATLVIHSITSGDFLEVMQHDRDNFPDTDILSASWIWCLVVLLVVISVAVVMTAISARLKKKYMVVRQAPPQMKMAVFGMDYEDKNAADIFIDIKNVDDDEIFPGIQNNARKNNDPIDDIFPPLYDDNGNNPPNNSGSDGSGDGGKSDDPFDGNY
ncbi:MAG: M28 family peptidase [Clostridiales bacterium]|nr:M28 family peptidase [Clostridiales bacterium]